MASVSCTGLLALGLTPIVVSGNRLQGLQGNGLTIETLLVSAKVEHNVFNAITGNGLIMLPGSAAGSVSVLGNELINIANGAAEATKGGEFAAIHLRKFLRARSRTTQSVPSATTLPRRGHRRHPR